MSNFSERLKELIEENDLSANRLAKEIKISGRTVQKWVCGEHDIHITNAIKIADYFGCSLNYLAGISDYYETVQARPLPPFYDSLRKVMEDNGFTRYRIAKETSIKDVYFTKWSKGAVPRLSTVYELATYLNVSLDYLTGRTDY